MAPLLGGPRSSGARFIELPGSCATEVTYQAISGYFLKLIVAFFSHWRLEAHIPLHCYHEYWWGHSHWCPHQPKYWRGYVPGIPGGVDAYAEKWPLCISMCAHDVWRAIKFDTITRGAVEQHLQRRSTSVSYRKMVIRPPAKLKALNRLSQNLSLTVDYIHESIPQAKCGKNPFTGNFWANR